MERIKKVILFGAGEFCKRYIERMGNEVEILAIADNNIKTDFVYGHKVIEANEIPTYDYDKVVICLNDYSHVTSLKATDDIINQLMELGIPDNCIKLQNVYYSKDDSRVSFLEEYARSVEKCKLEGAVAECGVYRGHFVHYINKLLSKHTLYLFDTFCGFDAKDIEEELSFSSEKTQKNIYECAQPLLINGNEKIALRRCEKPQNVIIRKGYVPDTFNGLEDERFVFVSLDLDLYRPTLEALRWFSKRMVRGGVICCHDYYHSAYNINKAITEFEKECKFTRFYIGEGSIVLVMLV